jgi:hypothetical protein
VKFLNILPIRVDSSSLLEMRIIQRIGTFAARMSRRSIVGRDPYSLDLPDPGALKTSEETPLAPWNTISIILCNICAPTALKGLCSFHPASERAVFLSSLFCARYSTPGACRPLLYYRLLYIYRFGRCCNFSALTEPCTSPKQDPLHKPADVASKPEVRRSNPIRSIQLLSPILNRGPWRLSTPERRPSQLDPGNSDRTVDCGRCARRSWVSRQTSLLWSLCTLPPASACACRCPLSPSRCPLSATMNRSASKERHKLLFLRLSTKLNTMSEKSRPTFSGHSSLQEGLPIEGRQGYRAPTVDHRPACLLRS